jgi:hypothetical protein
VQAIAAFFIGIKETLVLVNEIVSGAKALAQFVQDNKDEAWFKSSAESWKAMREAKTKDERTAAARRIRDSWASL